MNQEDLEDKYAKTKSLRKKTASVENLFSTISQDQNNNLNYNKVLKYLYYRVFQSQS